MVGVRKPKICAARAATSMLSAPMICGSWFSSISAWPSSVRSGQKAMSKRLPVARRIGATTLRVVPSLTVERRMTRSPSWMRSATCRVAASIMSVRTPPSRPSGVPTVMMKTLQRAHSSGVRPKVKRPRAVTWRSFSVRPGS